MKTILEKAELAKKCDESIKMQMDDLVPMLNKATLYDIHISYKFDAYGDPDVLRNHSALTDEIRRKGNQLNQLKEERDKIQKDLWLMCSEKWEELSDQLRNDPGKSFFYGTFQEKYNLAVRFGSLISVLQELDAFLKS